MKYRHLQVLNLISFVVLVVVNFLSVQLPFFGQTPGDVSHLYPHLFTPPDFIFSIWSFLYVLLGIFTISQAKGLFRRDVPAPREVSVIGYLFAASCIANIGWLFAWQSLHLVLSFAIIFVLWTLLVLTYYRLAPFEQSHWTFTVPFSCYLAWVAVSGLANLNVVLMDGGFDFFGLSPTVWTITLVVLSVLGGLLVLHLNRDVWFILVLLWTLMGILVKHSLEQTIGQTALVGMLLLAMSAGVVRWKKRQRKQA